MKLSCGPFKLLYQNGFIRHLRYGETEILRMIYFALRDENWSTIPLRIIDETIESTESSFSIHCSAVNQIDGADLLAWKVAIIGNDDGSITYSLEGKALKSYKKNRAGFCVLHPLKETIDQPVILSHPDGNRSESTFPRFIVSDDPFTEIASMKWRIDGNWFELQFTGDIFETEDQRNWSDASFKTFCTPLRLPFPATLNKGDLISQQINFLPERPLPTKAAVNQIRISRTETIRKLPEIGIGSSPSEEFNEQVFSVLEGLPFGHYRIDTDLAGIEWEDILSNDLMIAQRLALPLEVVLNLPQDPRDELDRFLNLLKREQVPIKKVTLLSKGELTTRQHHVSFVPLMKELLPGTQVGVGTDFNFTELNRHRIDKEGADYVTFALDPQEHATDDLTIIENLEAQYYGVISAHELYGIPVHISPVLLKRKYNPYATDPAAFTVPDEARFDERQHTPFAALWTLGSLKALGMAATEAVTYFQAVGPHGIVSAEGTPYPLYDVLKMLHETPVTFFFDTVSTAPLRVDAMYLEDGDILAWNYTGEEQEILLEGEDRTVILDPYEIRMINQIGYHLKPRPTPKYG